MNGTQIFSTSYYGTYVYLVFQETDIVCFWSISKAIFEAFQGPQIRLSFYVKQYYIITFAD